MAMGFSSPNPFPFVFIRIKPLVSLSNRSRHNQKVAARPARILLTRRVLEFQRHMDFVHVLLADLERPWFGSQHAKPHVLVERRVRFLHTAYPQSYPPSFRYPARR